MDKSILDIILNNPFVPQLKELFNLVLILADSIYNLLQKIVIWLWDIFSGAFTFVLNFTIDFVKLVLGYF